MSGFGGGAASGAAAGTMIMPGWGTAIGAGLGAMGGLMGDKAAKRAKKRQDMLYKQALAGVDLGASQGRQDVTESFGNQRSGMVNNLAEQGLTGSTAQDAALNSSLGAQQKAMSRISADAASQKAGLLGMMPTGPDVSSTANLLGGLSGTAGKLDMLGSQGKQGGGGGGGSPWDSLAPGSVQGPPNAMGEGPGGADTLSRIKLGGGDAQARMGGSGGLWDWFSGMFGG
jgi:hypothetical protein